MSDDILADVKAAAASTGGSDGDNGGGAPEPQGAGGQVDDGGSGLAEGRAPSADRLDDPNGDVASAAQRARDNKGRFAQKKADETPAETVAKVAKEAEAKPVEAQKTEEKPPEAPPAIEDRPPASMKPLAREAWGKTPPEVRAEFKRLDAEVRKVMQESAPLRKEAEPLLKAVEPYKHLMGAQSPDSVVGSLLQTAAALAQGGPRAAAVLASMVKSYRVDVDALAKALDAPAAQPQPLDPDALAAQAEQRFMERLQQRQQQQQAQEAAKEWESFAASGKGEFLDDIRDEVADAMELAARRNIALTPEQAYNRVLSMHRADESSEIGKALRQRDAAEAAKAQLASTQRARAAASSVKGQPTVVAATQGGSSSIMDDIKAAASRLSGR